MKKISNYELIELVDERRRAGEIIIDCSHDKDGTWYNIRENVEMSEAEAIKLIKEEEHEKHETLTDQFLRKNGIKKDKDGTPDIIGHVLGGYHRSIRKAHELTTGKRCEQCKEAIGLNSTYTSRQFSKDGEIFNYHAQCYIKKGAISSTTAWTITEDNDNEKK